jgi:tetratricopeptide (TPR) repeat protein
MALAFAETLAEQAPHVQSELSATTRKAGGVSQPTKLPIHKSEPLVQRMRYAIPLVILATLVALFFISRSSQPSIVPTPTVLATPIVSGSLSAVDYFERANDYANQGANDSAIADYTRAIELDPDFADAYYNRGNSYSNLDKPEEAIADYTHVVELKPDYLNAYYNRGNAYRVLEEHNKAIEDYNRVLEIEPGYVRAYNNRGFSYIALGQYQNALADFNKAIELTPDFANPYWGLGDVYYDLGRLDEALTNYQRYLDLSGDSGNAYVNGRIAELSQKRVTPTATS